MSNTETAARLRGQSFWSVSRKLLAVAGVIVTLGFAAGTALLLVRQEAELREGARRDGRMIAKLLAAQMSGGVRWKRADAVQATYAELVSDPTTQIAAVAVLDDTGTLLVGYNPGGHPFDFVGAIAAVADGAQPSLVHEDDRQIVIGTPVIAGKERQRVGTLLIAFSLDHVDEAVWRAIMADVSRSTAVLIVLICVLGAANAQIVGRPLVRMRKAMEQLAAGDANTSIPHLARRDEVGAMARAVEVFKDGMHEREHLRAEQEQAKARAVEEKQQVLERVAAEFEKTVGGIVGAVATAATQMESTARSMSGAAQSATSRTEAVATVTEHATSNVEAVAAAAEELSTSIAEIAHQVAKSSEIAGRAVDGAERTDATVQSLADAAQKIGDVIKLIQEIANQTNLLALNATIEAARAGEAGKGFAVVASEVKSLATQTAKATEEISSQITAIQSVTKQAVEAIRSIAATISEIHGITTTIAAAVEEQGAATQEIARNVQLASAGTREVSGSIMNVNEATAAVGAAANEVLGAAAELAQQSQLLKNEVGGFLATVRRTA